jgi:hypothetical protein
LETGKRGWRKVRIQLVVVAVRKVTNRIEGFDVGRIVGKDKGSSCWDIAPGVLHHEPFFSLNDAK